MVVAWKSLVESLKSPDDSNETFQMSQMKNLNWRVSNRKASVGKPQLDFLENFKSVSSKTNNNHSNMKITCNTLFTFALISSDSLVKRFWFVSILVCTRLVLCLGFAVAKSSEFSPSLVRRLQQIRDADRQIKTSELRLLEVTKNIFSLIGFLDYSKRLNNWIFYLIMCLRFAVA